MYKELVSRVLAAAAVGAVVAVINALGGAQPDPGLCAMLGAGLSASAPQAH